MGFVSTRSGSRDDGEDGKREEGGRGGGDEEGGHTGPLAPAYGVDSFLMYQASFSGAIIHKGYTFWN